MRKNIFNILITFIVLIVVGCERSPVKRYDRGIVVHVKGEKKGKNAPKYVRLQVESDNIIRVSATAEGRFPDPQSLIIVDRDVDTSFDVAENGDTVILRTSFLQAKVLISTGEIGFFYENGDTVLMEQNGGGKKIYPHTIMRENADGKNVEYKGWTTQAIFESPSDEAFYGLGQHQADEWNYKGGNVELYQYNTKVSVPFIVSNRNYGLLFDTYSLCRYGNPSDYQQLNDLFTLIDKDGVEGALTGTYSSPDAETLVRREDSLYFENLETIKNLPKIPLEHATIIYEGTLVPKESGVYKFIHYYSGYQKLYIENEDVYTEDVAGRGSNEQTIWRPAWNPNARKFDLNLEKGKKYSFKLVWEPDGDVSYCGLRAYAPVDSLQQENLSFWSEMSQQLDYYFILGDNIDEVIAGYRMLTGKAPIMPDWLFGYWQSRERYVTQEDILAALQGFRSRGLPIDNIVMDWNYWKDDAWGSFEFDNSRFPNPQGMVDSIHNSHAKIMISCWPKYYLNTENFKELNDKGYMYQQSIRDSLIDWIGYRFADYDAYAPEARAIFWRQMYEHLGIIGIDAWWMDASEPEILACTDIDYRKRLCGPTAFGSSDEYFNAYSIVNAEGVYDGQRSYETAGLNHDAKWLQKNATWDYRGFGNNFSADNKRVFLLTRSGFASQQRYSTATWSGDIGTRWEDMKAQITAALNFSISGIPYWSQDIGGFSVENRFIQAQRLYDETSKVNDDLLEWRELNVRWHEFGMWVPIYRSHGQYPYREPWNIAPEGSSTYEAIRNCMELRYRLLPYIYSLASEIYFHDYTLMRPLVMDFASDATVLTIGYQYMFGTAFMINPVYTYKARSREVYFPKGCDWYDFYSGKLVSSGGDSQMVEAPLEHIPIYVRAGSIVPFGPKVEYTRQVPNDELRIYVYEGDDGEFSLYEDEGVNYGYEAGNYMKILFSYDDASKTLTIGDQWGSFSDVLKKRTFVVVPISKDHPQGYDPNAEGQRVEYVGKKVIVQL